LLMAAAAAFLAYAVPASIVAQGTVRAGIGAVSFGLAERGLLALILATICGGAVWWLFDGMERPRGPKAESEPEIDLFAPAPTPQLRRADVHPDAPARRPLFAASDLGAPMADIAAGTTPFGRPPLFEDAPAVAPPPVDAVDADDADDMLLLDARYSMPAADDAPFEAIFTPAPAPTPATTPAPVSDDSIAGMMARLERGLERRGGVGMAPPADRPELRQALTELRRMTVGR
ncbi:MAG TPA: hypothetical protein VF649_12525, partial [Sphingomonas sp.]|uniref:hypothetical protein n=1 Tax=Sphingomonas sp. TaxID=28214 RepID=UPI002ED82DCE